MLTIDAKGVYYKQLNEQLKALVAEGNKEFHLINVNGQRYLGTGLNDKGIKLVIDGVPGNDLAIFMDGPTLIVNNNGQDSIANTMNSGKIIIKGNAGDVLGYAMRGGKLFVKGGVGYRVGIHMKEYQEQRPVLIVGGTAGNFLGEYMAGGVLILLGLNREEGQPIAGDYLGTGMHGGVIYVRTDELDTDLLGKEVSIFELDDKDEKLLDELLHEYCQDMELDFKQVRQAKFLKLLPVSTRPYGRLYAY